MNKVEYGTIVRSVLDEINTSYVKLVEVGLLLEYHCHLEDCLEHPQYLNLILKKLFLGDYARIINEIHHRSTNSVNYTIRLYSKLKPFSNLNLSTCRSM